MLARIAFGCAALSPADCGGDCAGAIAAAAPFVEVGLGARFVQPVTLSVKQRYRGKFVEMQLIKPSRPCAAEASSSFSPVGPQMGQW